MTTSRHVERSTAATPWARITPPRAPCRPTAHLLGLRAMPITFYPGLIAAAAAYPALVEYTRYRFFRASQQTVAPKTDTHRRRLKRRAARSSVD